MLKGRIILFRPGWVDLFQASLCMSLIVTGIVLDALLSCLRASCFDIRLQQAFSSYRVGAFGSCWQAFDSCCWEVFDWVFGTMQAVHSFYWGCLLFLFINPSFHTHYWNLYLPIWYFHFLRPESYYCYKLH